VVVDVMIRAGRPEIPSNGIGNFEQQNAGRVDNAEAFDGGDILRQYKLRIGAGM
jgi:hypothetical protein